MPALFWLAANIDIFRNRKIRAQVDLLIHRTDTGILGFLRCFGENLFPIQQDGSPVALFYAC